MTPQEHTLLDTFLARLQAAGPVAKDAEADALIRSRLEGHPDAGYLLVQRCLLVERALAEANTQIAALRQQAQASGGGSFLGGGVPEGFGRQPSQAYNPEPRWDARQDAPPPQAPVQAQPQGWRDRLFGGGAAQQAAPAAAGPSFLGTAATTAAGVAGGMFLFNGIEHLLGGNHGGGLGNSNSLFGANDAGSLGGPMTQNITENVFLEDDRAGGDKRQGFLDGDLDDSGGNADNWADNDAGNYPDDGDNFI
ncbi:DUF2076 family protein [Xylophilus rhododendri]|uniref:DUF2076 family protein n=1 Tax=Xylophilus rhododendri TaxID=2697032 RepID=A0A857J7N1_9BURK|nr:DUF2076 family protein [Xylophilus rhododendri]QHI98795.1 DUF2076 family protein [Xylophilus rhododendri]